MSATEETVVLGPEYDEGLRESLRVVLRGMGATFGEESWALAGSQELESVLCLVDGQEVRIEAETYIGLSITGSVAIVERICAALKDRHEVATSPNDPRSAARPEGSDESDAEK